MPPPRRRRPLLLFLLLFLACLPVSAGASSSSPPPDDPNAKHPVLQGEVALSPCTLFDPQVDGDGGSGGSGGGNDGTAAGARAGDATRFILTRLFVSPSPALRVGSSVDFTLQGVLDFRLFPHGLSTRDVHVRLILSPFVASLSGEAHRGSHMQSIHTDLCAALGFGMNANHTGCPDIVPDQAYNASAARKPVPFTVKSNPGKVNLPGSDRIASGVYDVELALEADPPSGGAGGVGGSSSGNIHRLNTCGAFEQVVQTSTLDYIPASVAFVVASAASWHLGKAFPSIKLPLITGYLLVGVVVGPYVCNLVTRYHVWLLGQTINDVALSFISFAAGEEIFFPELRGILRTILRQMGLIAACTMVLVSGGFYALTLGAERADGAGGALQFESFVPGTSWAGAQDVSCRVAIAMLVGIIMVARSPATAVAVAQEIRAEGPAVKLVMGVTVMSDIVVLVGFAVLSTVATSLCPVAGANGYVEDNFDVVAIVILVAQFVAIVAVGFLVGVMLLFILWMPVQRFKLCGTIKVYRSYLKGALIIPLGFCVFTALRAFSAASVATWGREISVEPLMVCMIGSSIAGHRSGVNREKFANILDKSAPYIFLPFFTLTGASLELDRVTAALPLACCVALLRVVAILAASGLDSCRNCSRCCDGASKTGKTGVGNGNGSTDTQRPGKDIETSPALSAASTTAPASALKSPRLLSNRDGLESPLLLHHGRDGDASPSAGSAMTDVVGGEPGDSFRLNPDDDLKHRGSSDHALDRRRRFDTGSSAGLGGDEPAMLSSSLPEPPAVHWFWLGTTYISQAGVALGLAFEIKSRFTRWGDDFATLVLSVVVINQLIGPPLCKLGLLRLGVTGVADTDDAVKARQRARTHSENIDEFYHSPSFLRRLRPREGARMLDLTADGSGPVHLEPRDNGSRSSGGGGGGGGGKGRGGGNDCSRLSVAPGAAGSLRQVRTLLHRPVVTLDIIADPNSVGGGARSTGGGGGGSTASNHTSPELGPSENKGSERGPAGDTGSGINVGIDIRSDGDHLGDDDADSDNDDETLLRVLSQPGTRLRIITTDPHVPTSPLRPALSRSSSAYGSLGAARSLSDSASNSPTALSRSLSGHQARRARGGGVYRSQPSAGGSVSSHSRAILIRSPSSSFRKRLQRMHDAAAAVHGMDQ